MILGLKWLIFKFAVFQNMKVSTSKAFKIIYSLYQHEYLGYLFESFAVQLDQAGKLTLTHQNISSKNAPEFSSCLDSDDYNLIDLMDSMHQGAVIQQFHKTKDKPEEFFQRYYRNDRFKEARLEIDEYLELRRARILELIGGKPLFEMGQDGEPAWRPILVKVKPATVLFHFRRTSDNTRYFPTIKHDGSKLEFQYRGGHLVCLKPAWLLVDNALYSFSGNIDGNKLKPFLNRRFILIPNKIEETYYQKFVAPLIGSFDVSVRGFEIRNRRYAAQPVLLVSDYNPDEVAREMNQDGAPSPPWIQFRIVFEYGPYAVHGSSKSINEVFLEKTEDSFIFQKVIRDHTWEHEQLQILNRMGLTTIEGRSIWTRSLALRWLTTHQNTLSTRGFNIRQSFIDQRKYFLGISTISLDVKESTDWFDVFAQIRFGDYLIPFVKIRDHILNRSEEFILPNGEIGLIPASWFSEYSELFGFVQWNQNNNSIKLGKHHLSLARNLDPNLKSADFDRRLSRLENADGIEQRSLPLHFKGALRPYQHSGFNWLIFLNQNGLGGCLADDMGLGKTVQTLALLQDQKQTEEKGVSLLIMPTSLLYNWEQEAAKFTPQLKVLNYSGSNRSKNIESFRKYDLVLTSYGITRIDIGLLENFDFNYVILDESQVIKNPSSIISKAVQRLQSRRKLILTGTPLENSTLDLWSQMNFVNPGLLGSQAFFMREFMRPIEKNGDKKKVQRLSELTKPFILRRHKGQVAKELPPKVEHIHYSSMTKEQEETYERIKSQYRNRILENIESIGMEKSQFLILEGLTKLRQLANHPQLIDPEYAGASGKMSNLVHMLQSIVSERHKVLLFSQFVKYLRLIRETLNSSGIDFAYLDGSTQNRKEQVERFQSEEDLKVFLISLKAGGLGLNLTKADYVLIADPWWNPAVESQAVDRAHRIGQENKVFIYKFITKNTVEEKILQLQNRKIHLMEQLITPDQKFVKGISKQEVEQLLS